MTPRALIASMAADSRLASANRIAFTSVGSTNDVGKAIAAVYLNKASILPDSVILALEQTAGRGRLARSWSSPPGGIYASYLRSCPAIEDLQTLPLRVAVALRRALEKWASPACRLKWPNDLIVGDRKLGGILIETLSMRGTVIAVVGFGINCERLPPEASAMAVSLVEVSAEIPPFAEVLVDLLVALERELAERRSTAEVVSEYARWSTLAVGDPIRCRTTEGLREGQFLGFDETGLLRLATVAGEQVIASGEILESSMDS